MDSAVLTTPDPPALPSPEILEHVLLGGDLAKLTPSQRLSYYRATCESLGLNPLTRPLAYLNLSGRLTLYALKDATEQLRKRHGVSITALTSQRLDDVFVVTATATDRTGRQDAATGAVPIASLKGEALANGLMKAETKAKRRVTLSICGLGLLDETELATIPDARPLDCDPTTGEMLAPPPRPDPAETPITAAQRRRLFALARGKGWTTAQLRAHLLAKYGLQATSELRRALYDTVCEDIAIGPPAAPVAAEESPF